VGAAQPAVWRRLAASAGPADPLAEARSRAEAVALARAALLRRAEESCDDLVALSRTLLQEVPGPCRLRCHPADAAALGPEAVPDERVDRGGLIVEAADGEREATLGGRLARLEAALRAGGASG
jgi:flagellar biosynthesis/type III secretory pathway protein FliH